MTTYIPLTIQQIIDDPLYVEKITKEGTVIHYYTLKHGYACKHMNGRIQQWIYDDFFAERNSKVIEIDVEVFENYENLSIWTISAYPSLRTFVDGKLVHDYIGSNASQWVFELKSILDGKSKPE